MVIPDPPVDMHTPEIGNIFFSGAGFAVALAGFLYSLWLARKIRNVLPVVVYISAGIAAVLLEPHLDVNGGCWWPRFGGWNAFHLYGTPVPTWAVAAYFWFVGGQALLVWRALRRWPSSETVWRSWLVVMVTNLVLETPGLMLGLYAYWGQQPLEAPWGLPLWWLPVNACMPLLAGLLVFKLEPWLRGLRMLLVVPLIPMAAAMAEAAASTPAWLVLHSDVPMVVTQLAGLSVFVLAAALVSVMAASVAQPVFVGQARTNNRVTTEEMTGDVSASEPA